MHKQSKTARNEHSQGEQPLHHPRFPDLVWKDGHWVHHSNEKLSGAEVDDLMQRLRDERAEKVMRLCLGDTGDPPFNED